MPWLLASPVKVVALVGGVAAAGAGGYALYDASRPDPLPLLPVADGAWYAPGPAADELPFAAPAPVGYIADPSDAYAWPERAYAVNYAFADYPPDYAWFYDDIEYWVWTTGDRWVLEIEPLRVGYRRYYYSPWYDEPYFILDDGWGYGFDRGVLVLVIDPSGRSMGPDFVRARSDWAGRYLLRAQELRRARLQAARSDQLWRIDEDRWRARRDGLVRDPARLERAALRQADWRAYRDRSGLAEQRFFAAERDRRAARGDRVNADRREGLRERIRRSDDPPAAVTVADARRRARADELVSARDRATTRAFLRDEARAEQVRQRRAERIEAGPDRVGRDDRRTERPALEPARPDRTPVARAERRLQGEAPRPRADRFERAPRPDRIRRDSVRPRPEPRIARADRIERAPRADRVERGGLRQQVEPRVQRAPRTDVRRERIQPDRGDRGGGRN